jgi:predicted acetyltransferase
MSVVIAKPSLAYERAFIAMVADLESRDPENAAFYAGAKRGFEEYVRRLLDEERGLNLSEGRVPHRWLLDDGAVVAVTRLRHNIDTTFLANEAGHIGYDVAPSCRGKGYGHRALQAALSEAQALGIDRVLLLADESNVPSRRTIMRQHGELESIVYSEHWRQRVCRYWIRVGANDG